MTRIALDAMGGDHAPGEIVVGAVEAAVGIPGVKVLLVGQLAPIQAELDKLPKDLKKSAQTAMEHGTLEIVHAPDVAEMDGFPDCTARRSAPSGMTTPPAAGSPVVTFSPAYMAW